jgi:hypothetical protein
MDKFGIEQNGRFRIEQQQPVSLWPTAKISAADC